MNLFYENDINEIVIRLSTSLKKLEGKTILITGAAGFLGRYFVATFQRYNQDAIIPINLIALDNYVTSTKVEKNDVRRNDPNIEWIYGDAGIASNLPDDFDYIIHAAGIASPEHYRANPLKTIDVAVSVTRELLERAKNNNARMLFFSSSEIYGDPSPNHVPTPESYRGNVSTRGPRACYDESKRMGETLCWIFETYSKVHVSVVRPFNVYGPGMMPKDYRVLPNFAASWCRGESLKVYGHGNQTRTFCYISDAVVGFMKVLIDGANPNVYNVGNPEPEISINDLAQLIKKNIDSEIRIERIEYPTTYPEDEPNRRCPNIERMRTEFNFVPEISLTDGILRFFNWARQNYTSELLKS